MIVETADLIVIGKIVKPFGVRGAFRVRSLSDVPGRFQGLGQVTLEAPSGQAIMTTVTSVREDRGAFIVGVEAFSSPEEAAVFRGGWIKIPSDQSPPLPDGQYYEFQLIGITVRDEAGRTLGILEEVLETASNPVFVIRGDGREMLIPGIRDAIASVNIDGRTMTIRSETGLVERS